MTAQQLFELTVGMMGMNATNASTYEESFLPQLNTLLAQTFNLENNVRTKKGAALLTTYPIVQDMSETLTYQDEVTLKVIPWGIARLMALTDDEYVKAGFYGSQYVDEYNLAAYFIASEITDVFSTSEDDE